MGWLILLLLLYIILNYYLAKYTYNSMLKFYEDESNTESNNIHKKYFEFKRNDKLNFWRIYFGFLFLIWVRFILVLLCALSLFSLLKIGFMFKLSDYSRRKYILAVMYIIVGASFIALGLNFREKRFSNEKYIEKVYKYYFGEDYQISYTDRYSLITCNHISWLEILFNLYKFAPGFISKISVKKIPFIGFIAEELQCLFLDRTNENDRKNVAFSLSTRQSKYMTGESLAPLLIFPEGTVTSGKHILKMKKGAFINLLPIKPMMIKLNNDNLLLSTGELKFQQHLAITESYLYHNVDIYELPIVTPNDYMFENFQHLGKNKIEIYSEVLREIYCKIGDFEKSNKTFDNVLDYLSLIYERKISNT